MFCCILGEAAADELFYSIFTFIQHGSGSSAIMPLSATLPLAIGLKFFWFLIALLLYPKSAIYTWIILPRSLTSLPAKPVFKRILTKVFYQYILSLMSKENMGSSMIELTLIFSPVYVFHDINVFWPASSKFPWLC